MPTQRGRDKIGPFFRWGTKGKKYYFLPRNKASMRIAYKKANRQGIAIRLSELRRYGRIKRRY